MKIKLGTVINKDGKIWEVVELLSPVHCVIRELWTLNDEFYFYGDET